ncbi:MAG: hypothetical protein JRI25_30015 [Deltaproteobacteria bacterium]|nr:hypothetical protein [Deltaproteobacteria bacterium]
MSKNAEQVFAVLRHDRFLLDVAKIESTITVKEVVRDLELAKAEVSRLNASNAEKDCHYFWQTTRLYPPGESASSRLEPDED